VAGGARPPRYRGFHLRPSLPAAEESELTVLVTNLDDAAHALFDFYNQRQTIEAFFKASKHVFGTANLRSRPFLAIAVFLGFVLLTHNLLVWTKSALFAGTLLVRAPARQLVEKIIRVPLLWCGKGPASGSNCQRPAWVANCQPDLVQES
jgi:hypothetical protein